MKQLKNNILLFNIIVLATMILSLIFKKHFFIFIMLIFVNILFSLNLSKIEKIKKDYFEIKSLTNKLFVYLTYISILLFFIIFIIAFQLKQVETLVNSYMIYLIFWILSKYTINFYTKENIVISSNIYSRDSIKSVILKEDKHSDKVNVQFYFYNNKNINFVVQKKEFDEIKSRMNLFGKIKY